MYCSSCGLELSDGVSFCYRCGVAVVISDADTGSSNPRDPSIISTSSVPPPAAGSGRLRLLGTYFFGVLAMVALRMLSDRDHAPEALGEGLAYGFIALMFGAIGSLGVLLTSRRESPDIRRRRYLAVAWWSFILALVLGRATTNVRHATERQQLAAEVGRARAALGELVETHTADAPTTEAPTVPDASDVGQLSIPDAQVSDATIALSFISRRTQENVEISRAAMREVEAFGFESMLSGSNLVNVDGLHRGIESVSKYRTWLAARREAGLQLRARLLEDANELPLRNEQFRGSFIKSFRQQIEIADQLDRELLV